MVALKSVDIFFSLEIIKDENRRSRRMAVHTLSEAATWFFSVPSKPRPGVVTVRHGTCRVVAGPEIVWLQE